MNPLVIGRSAERVLGAFSGVGEMTFAEISAASGLPSAAIDNVVATLVRHGYVQRIRRADAIVRYQRAYPSAQPSASLRQHLIRALEQEPCSAADLVVRLRERYALRTVVNCLDNLRRAGVVRCVGSGRSWAWHLNGHQFTPPAPMGDHSSPAGSTPVVSSTTERSDG